MNNESIPEKPAVHLDTGTRLAFERTYLAQERTHLAWLRTALALISFGFTIAKFFELLQKQAEPGPLMSPRTVGILLISTGLLALLLAGLQHVRALSALRQQCPGLPVSLAAVTSSALGLLGVLALIGAILR